MKIILKGNPLSTQHIYRSACRGRFPTRYMIKQGKERKAQYQLEAREQYNGEIILVDVFVEMTLFFKTRRKRDPDNYGKLELDSLEGIVYENDCQIQKLLTIREYSKENPRTELEIKIIK